MMTVKLSSVGNPDFGQYAPLSLPKLVNISSLKEASEKCRTYIAYWNLGGGNWSGGQVYNGKKQIANISFNGRIWDLEDNEIQVNQ